MAIANLHETLLSYTIRKNQLNLEIAQLQSQKTLVMRSQGDTQDLSNARKTELRNEYKTLFENDPDLQVKYSDYTEIPEFEEEMEFKIVGSTEANSLAGKISNESPLGIALIGKTVGDDVVVETQFGTSEFKVLKIERSI